MSAPALQAAVAEQIKAKLGLKSGECQVNDGPRPTTDAGQVFVAVHQGSWRNKGTQDYLWEIFGVLVTVSIKAGHIPENRWGDHVAFNAEQGMDFLSRQIVAVIHSSYPVMNAANGKIGQNASGFFTPLYFRDGGPAPQDQGAGWWSGKGDGLMGISRTLVFDGAERITKQPEIEF